MPSYAPGSLELKNEGISDGLICSGCAVLRFPCGVNRLQASYSLVQMDLGQEVAAVNARSPRVGKIPIANGISSIVLLHRSPYLEFCSRETKFFIYSGAVL